MNRSKTGNLPVYLDYRSGRTKVVTMIRKIEGDVSVSSVAMCLWGVAASWCVSSISDVVLGCTMVAYNPGYIAIYWDVS